MSGGGNHASLRIDIKKILSTPEGRRRLIEIACSKPCPHCGEVLRSSEEEAHAGSAECLVAQVMLR